VQINHVKGHQDQAKLKRPLTIPETLNIECDRQASDAMINYPENMPTNHPLTEAGYPHLLINTTVQYRHIQHTLRAAATTDEYKKYLTNKFQWTEQQYNEIAWPAFQQAFQSLAINERRFVSRLIHEWLPLQSSHITESLSAQQHCPSCQRLLETPEHLLQCPHPQRQHAWEEFQQRLHKICDKQNIPQPIQDLISEGYRISRDTTRPTPTHIQKQETIQTALYQQATLGWKQLLYGRITQAWQRLLTTQAPQMNSTHFLSKIIRQGWTVLITIWQIRNTHLHPPNDQLTDRTTLHALVENIFHIVSTDPTLTALLSYTTIDQIMQKSVRKIRKWIKICTIHIHDHQDGIKSRALLNTHDIRKYYQPREQPPQPETANKNLLWPP